MHVPGSWQLSDLTHPLRYRWQYISDKNLIFEIVKELLYQERLKDSVRLLGIALSNLNTEQKKTVVIQLQFDF